MYVCMYVYIYIYIHIAYCAGHALHRDVAAVLRVLVMIMIIIIIVIITVIIVNSYYNINSMQIMTIVIMRSGPS